jgi:hypothetical protein
MLIAEAENHSVLAIQFEKRAEKRFEKTSIGDLRKLWRQDSEVSA